MRWSATAAALILTACAERVPPPPVLQSAYAHDIMATVSVRDAQIRTLRTKFSVTTTTPDVERTIAGALLVDRPDRLRFRLFLPFGLTVFDYLRVADQAWLLLPMGADEPGSARAVGYARDVLPRAFATLAATYPLSTYDPIRGEVGALTVRRCTSGEGDMCTASRELRIRMRDGAIDEERVTDSDGGKLRIRYGDYRVVGIAYLPFRIAIEDLTRPDDGRVEVAIDRYEVNPTLADDLFAPAPGSEPIPVIP